jgi:RHS repeat-associated protein
MNSRGLVEGEDIAVGAVARHRAYGYTPNRYLANATDSDASYAYSYDSAGLSSASVEGHKHTFDRLGRAVQHDDVSIVYGPNGHVARARRGTKEWAYLYDESGHRIAKLVAGVPVAVYLRDDSYLDATARVEPVRASGQLVGVLRHSAIGGATASAFQLLATDSRETVLADTDGTPRLPSPYGARAVLPDLANAVDYASKRWDADLGVVRMGVRDYDPALNRFTTSDPLYLEMPEKCLTNRVSCNLYSYADDNPNSFVDPDGTDPTEHAIESRMSVRETQTKAGNGKAIEVMDRLQANAALTVVSLVAGGPLASLVPRWVWLTAALASTTQIKSSDDAAGHFAAASIAAGAIRGGAGVEAAVGETEAVSVATAQASATVKSGKWDYFFGRVTSNPHNQARSIQNLKDLARLGFDEAAGGREALTRLFQESQGLPEVARHVTEHGITITRTARIGDVGAIDIKYFYPGGNMDAVPEVSTIIPKVFR